jgi:hypothetical protein
MSAFLSCYDKKIDRKYTCHNCIYYLFWNPKSKSQSEKGRRFQCLIKSNDLSETPTEEAELAEINATVTESPVVISVEEHFTPMPKARKRAVNKSARKLRDELATQKTRE